MHPTRALFLAFVAFAITAKSVAAALPEVDLPFTFTDGFIRVEVHLPPAREPLSFLLDSGASASVLSLRTAQRLHLPLGAKQIIRGVDVQTCARRLPKMKATIADLKLADIFLAVDLSAADQLCSRPVDGLIGVGFFHNRVVQIDYQRHLLRLNPTDPVAPAASLPLKSLNGVLCLPVRVNDSAARWTRLDTGCNDALHWVVPHFPAHRHPREVSIGFVNHPEDTSLSSVALGSHRLTPVRTTLHGSALFPGEAGLLGNELLSQFLVTIDSRNLRICLQDAPR